MLGSNVATPELSAAIMLAVVLILMSGQTLVLTFTSDYTYSDLSFEMEMDGYGYEGFEIETFSLESSNYITSESS